MAFKYLDYREQLLEEKRKNQALQAVVAEQEVKLQANLTATRKLIRVDELTEDELTEMVDLYDKYEIDKAYKIDEVFMYDGKLYKVIQAHRSQENWLPSELPALYLNLLPDNIIPEWKQPSGSHDAYKIGDKVIFDSKVYESLINGNTWSPTGYPQGWKLA